MERKGFSLAVRVHGKTLNEYPHINPEGEPEVWVEGRKGKDFVLRIWNHSSRRVRAVVAVDGLDAISGEEASFDSPGYILDGFEKLDIPGWRLDNDNVAKFKFSKVGKSYTAKAGKGTDNVGVIGVAFFYEKVKTTLTITQAPPVHHHFHTIHHAHHHWQQLFPGSAEVTWTADPCCRQSGTELHVDDVLHSYTNGAAAVDGVAGASCNTSVDMSDITAENCARGGEAVMDCFVTSEVKPSLGTEFGKEQQHKVREVPFEQARDVPDEVLSVRYGTRKELQRRGVNMDRRGKRTKKPNAFPGSERGCTPPEGWRG